MDGVNTVLFLTRIQPLEPDLWSGVGWLRVFTKSWTYERVNEGASAMYRRSTLLHVASVAMGLRGEGGQARVIRLDRLRKKVFRGSWYSQKVDPGSRKRWIRVSCSRNVSLA